MTSQEFVKGFYLERKSLVEEYFGKKSQSEVTSLISDLNLDDKGKEKLKQILNSTLRDAFYSILLGLDGEANIGNKQICYEILDEQGNTLTGGEIESFAYEYFHNNKLEIDEDDADFIADLTYNTEVQGGRQTPAKSGYRPQIKFDFIEMMTSGQQIFIDRNFVFPGDKVEAKIKILAVDYFEGQLAEKMRFEFREGSVIIGTGQIKHILNPKLKRV